MDKATIDIVQVREENVDTRQRTIEKDKKPYKVPKLCMDCGKSFTRRSSLIAHQIIHTGEKLFMCSECGNSFGLKSSLVRHMRTHIPKMLKICPDCGKSFNRSSSLFQHQKVHRPKYKERPYGCQYCEKSFTRASELVVHQRIHKQSPLLESAECEESMKNLDERSTQNIIFSECEEHFRGSRSLTRQQEMNEAESTTTEPNNLNDAHNTLLHRDCNVPQAFQPANSLDQMRDGTFYTEKKACEKRAVCMDCGKSFTRRSSLIVHQRTHTGEQLFMCSECGRKFGLKSSMVRHMRRTHTHPKILLKRQKLHRREKPYKCPQCEKSFCRASQLVAHERNHKIEIFSPKSEPEDSNLPDKENDHYEDKNAEKSHICLECGKCFTRQTALKRHQRIHKGNSCLVNTQNSIFHSDTESGTNCSTSDAVYEDGTEAPKKEQPDVTQQVNPGIAEKSYIVIKHGGNTDRKSSREAKSILCMDCGKCFTRKHSLIVHQRVHTGEKLFMCADCGKRFSLKSSLVRHTKTHCPKILNICSECGKAFSRYCSLFQHQKVHRRPKPYKCPSCQKSFSQASHLSCHQKTHKVVQSYPKSEPGEDTDGQHKVNPHVDNCEEEPHVGGDCGKRFTENPLMTRHQIDNSESSAFADTKHNADCSTQPLQAETQCRPSSEVDVRNVKSQDLCNAVSTDTESEKMVKRDCAMENSVCKQTLSSNRRSYYCIQCGKSFTRKCSLIVHQRIHTGEKPFICRECGKRFGFKCSLVRHLRTHTGKMFNICSECGIYFSRYCDLLLHLENHVGQLQFTHNELSEMEARDESLNAQKGGVTEPLINEEDSGLPRGTGYVLPITSSINDYSDPHQEDKIQEETLNIVKENTSENVCVDGEPTTSQKNEHVCTDTSSDYGRKEVNISESFTEGSCGKRVRTRNYTAQRTLDVMKNHNLGRGVCGGSDHILRRSHSREKCFSCSECGKSFTRRSSLIVHQRIHTGEKLFMCTECGKRFGLKSSMVRHMRKTHRTESFKCVACKKNFKDYAKFLEHQTSHLGNLPYTEPELSVN